MEFIHLFVAGVLLWASLHDLKKFQVPHYVFLIGFAGLAVAPLFSSLSLSYLGMGSRALMVVGVGVFLRLLSFLGGADIASLALAAAVLPSEELRIIVATVFLSMYLWSFVYVKLFGGKHAPAVPGILLGYLALVL